MINSHCSVAATVQFFPGTKDFVPIHKIKIAKFCAEGPLSATAVSPCKHISPCIIIIFILGAGNALTPKSRML